MKSQTRRRFFLGSLWGLAAPFLAWSNVRAQTATVGERFHRDTALSWRGLFAELFQSKPPRPAQHKAYPAAKRLTLPEPDHKGLSVETVIKKRRSVRKYAGGQLSLPPRGSPERYTGNRCVQHLRLAPCIRSRSTSWPITSKASTPESIITQHVVTNSSC